MDVRTTGSPWQLIRELLSIVLQQSGATALSIKSACSAACHLQGRLTCNACRHLTLGSHACKQSSNEALLTQLDNLFGQLKASPLPQFVEGVSPYYSASHGIRVCLVVYLACVCPA